MSYSDILSIYNAKPFSCKCINNDQYHPDGHRIQIELYKNTKMLTVQGKEITWNLNNSVAHLDYIGFCPSLRDDGLLSEIHKNCTTVMKKSLSIQKVTLSPLTHVVTLWLYLGFKFIRPSEKDNFILTLIDWIDENNIQYNIENIEHDIMSDTIKNLKEELFLYDFPKSIKKYISNLYKDVA